MCIMFSPANESLLCINCFRDLPPDIRAQCLDLDTAYQQKCDRLQRGLKAVGELEVIIKDEMSAYRSLLKELHINAMREESTIHVFSKILQGVVTQTEDKLIETVKSELQTKEIIFEEKLKTLESLQSNVQAYLTLSTAFISSASKFELLKLANGLVERLSDIGNVVQPAKISPENSVISSNFKAEFSQSLKELLHQDLWMHNHLASLNAFSPVPKNTGEEMCKPQQSCCSTNSGLVTHQPEIKVPLPFLGRSQSLLNIPLDLNKQLITAIEPKAVVVQQQAVLSVQPPTSAVPQPARRTIGSNNGGTKRNGSKPEGSKPDIKYQSLPHSSKEENKSQHRREASSTMPHPVRSKSVEAKSAMAQQQQQYDVSQLELFAAIHQSRQAVSSRSNSKNLTVTSALVGVRQSDRNGSSRAEQKNGKVGSTVADPLEKVVPANAKNPSGHVCVVQALVHQDGDAVRNSSATQAETNTRVQQRQRTWEPVYEPLDGHAGRPIKSDADTLAESETSIELTADQVRQLIRAISAAQSNTAGSLGGCWSSEVSRPSASSSRVPERDSVVAKQPSTHQHRNMHRNDSFEGHEEAVRMLVGAIQEIQQLCTDKKQDST